MQGAAIPPHRTHRQRVLADRDGKVQGRAKLQTHRAHRCEQIGVVRRFAASGHPVGGKFNVAKMVNIGGGDIGNRLRHRQSRRCRRIEHRHRRPLAHRHGSAMVAAVVVHGDRHIRHRHLPRPHHLVARHQAGDATVGNGNQKRLVRHRRKPQHPIHRLLEVEPAVVEAPLPRFYPPRHATRARQRAQDESHR